MHHDLIPFAFEDHLVRVFEVDGAPWFVAKDVAAALGIVWKGDETVSRIPERWKGVRNLRTPGGQQFLLIISEPAVYKLAFRSNKPEAEAFTDWVAEEVLPVIRRTGRYEPPDSDAAPEADGLGPLSDLSSRCRLVEITERLAGKEAARALWRHLGLPWVAEMEPRGAVVAPADDAVARFALEGIERAPGVVAPAAMLWHAFSAFCERHDLVNPGEKSFFTRFSRMGFSKRKSAGRSVYQSIRPRAPNDSAGEGRAE